MAAPWAALEPTNPAAAEQASAAPVSTALGPVWPNPAGLLRAAFGARGRGRAAFVPTPGPWHGPYPQADDGAAVPGLAAFFSGLDASLAPALACDPGRPGALTAALNAAFNAARSTAPTSAPTPAPQPRQEQAWLGAMQRAQADAAARPVATWLHSIQPLRAALARQGLCQPSATLPLSPRDQILAGVAAVMAQTLGRAPFANQLQCARALLDAQLVEMATGEGKTLALALAAAVAALAGVPVHLMTANDYLAARDAHQLAPFFQALGLSVGVVQAADSPQVRRAAYAAAVAYCTAREVAFDYLRDGLSAQANPALQGQGGRLRFHAQALAGVPAPALRLPGLCMALVDEADSLLIDESTMPLVLSESHDDPALRAACFQALSLVRGLRLGEDFRVDEARQRVEWSVQGEQHFEAAVQALGGIGQNHSHARELADLAAWALHGLQADQHYLVRAGRIELLDALSARSALGRQWSRGLQTLVELKEGCKPSPSSRTVAQTSYQRFFGRYLHLGGTSGTLLDARGELAAVYAKTLVCLPPRLAPQGLQNPPQLFVHDAARERAMVQRVAALVGQGRPVLLGVDSVAAARSFSAALAAAGLVHRVLDARHDAEEADTVAQAGQRGAITVATAMAGRGTDIALGPGVAALGGLHVLSCQDSATARAERQLLGRAARQGDPGSHECWWSLSAPRWQKPAISSWLLARRQPDDQGRVDVPAWLLEKINAQWQRNHRRAAQKQRQALLKQDRLWQSTLAFTRFHA